MNQRKAGILLSYVYTMVHMIVNLLYVPIFLNRIGQSEYGLYQLVGAIISYLNVTESLLSTGVLRYYCLYNSIGDEQKKENVLYSSKKIYGVFSLIVAIAGVLCVFVFQMAYKFSLSRFELFEAIFMIVVMIATLIINLMNAVYTAAITANERFVFLKTLSIITTILQPLAILCVVGNIPYAGTVVIIQFVISCFAQIVKRFYCEKRLNIKIKYHYRDKNFERNLFSLSLSILLVVIADQIFWKTDQLIIGKMIGTAAVAVYAVGAQIYLNYSPVGTAIASVFMPRLSELLDRREEGMEEVSELFIKVGRISFMLLSAVLVGFGLYGKEFISVWAGENYLDAYYIALVVMIPLTVDVMQNMGLTILQIKGKYSFRGKIYLTIAIMNVISTIYLVKYNGIIGAAISTSVAMALGNGLIMNIYYKKVIGLDIKRFWREIFSILPSTGLAFVIGKLTEQISICNPWLELGAHVGSFTAFYCVILYFLAFNQYEKNLICSIFNRCRKNQI